MRLSPETYWTLAGAALLVLVGLVAWVLTRPWPEERRLGSGARVQLEGPRRRGGR